MVLIRPVTYFQPVTLPLPLRVVRGSLEQFCPRLPCWQPFGWRWLVISGGFGRIHPMAHHPLRRPSRRRRPVPHRSAPTGSATSNSISGCLAAIFSNTLAGPVGVRRPCSQFCSVSTLIPKIAANFDCDKPSSPRTRTRLESGLTRKTRPGFNFPRLIRFASRRLCFNSSKSSLFITQILPPIVSVA